MIVIDASVAVDWLLPTGRGPTATVLTRSDVLVAPALLHAEVTNALWKTVSRGLVAAPMVGPMLHTLARMHLTYTADLDLADEALRLAIANRHPAYDCFYLALARREGASLASLDARLNALAAALTIPLWTSPSWTAP